MHGVQENKIFFGILTQKSLLECLHLSFWVSIRLLLRYTFFFWYTTDIFLLISSFAIHAYLLMFFLKNQSIISFLSLGCLIKEICLLNSSDVFSTSPLIYSEVKNWHLKILAQNYNTAMNSGKAYSRYWEISNKNTQSDFYAFFLACPSSYMQPEQMHKLSNLKMQ